MKTKTFLFSVLVALFAIVFNVKALATGYSGTPYGGTPWTVPGTVEAENYDIGGEGIAYHDADAANNGGKYRSESVDIEATGDVSGGYNVGWSDASEWLKYTVDVQTAGDYYIAVRYTKDGDGSFTFSFASSDTITVSAFAPSTGGWGNWKWLYMKVNGLKAGVQVMTVNPGANVNYFIISQHNIPTGVTLQETGKAFVGGSKLQLTPNIDAIYNTVTWKSLNTAVATVNSAGLVTGVAVGEAAIVVTTDSGSFTDTCKVTALDSSIPFGGTSWAIPGTIEAENYDLGGESLAYHDAEATNYGGKYRPTEGVDVEATSDVSGGYNIGWTDPGEWLKYTVNVQTAGDYYIAVRYKSGGAGSITFSFASSDTINVTIPAPVSAQAIAPVTGGAWGWISTKVTGLKAGKQVLTVTPTANINYFIISQKPVTGVTVPETAIVRIGSPIQLKATVLPADAPNKAVTWTSSNEAVATIDATGLVTAIAPGETNIVATTDDGSFKGTCKVTTTNTSTPYGGVAWAIPGTIEAENFDIGGEGIAYHDSSLPGNYGGQYRSEGVDIENSNDNTGGGYTLGWTDDTEWLKYTVNVQTAGDYYVAVRYKNGAVSAAETFSFVSGIDTVTVSALAPSTNWDWVSVKVTLKAGTQVMIVKSTANVNYYTISKQPVTGVTVTETASIIVGSTFQLTATVLPAGAGNKSVTWKSLNTAVATVSNTGLVTAITVGKANIVVTTNDGSFTDTCKVTTTLVLSTPYGGTPWAIPGTIEAENYDDGGEGVAYHDAEVFHYGTGFRATESVDVDLATSDATGGGYYVGWTDNTEWLKYTVDVKTAGDYYIAIRYTKDGAGSFAFSFISGSDTAKVYASAPSTGGWNNWNWLTIKVTGLKAGVQVMKVNPVANINYVVISQNPVTGVTVQHSGKAFVGGSSLQLIANVLPTDAANKVVTWKSLNTSVATVNNAGLVTAIALGQASIVVTTDDGGFTDTCKVTTANVSVSYGGLPWAIPGTIEAENYDDGGEGIAYHDADAIQNGASNGNFRPTEGVDVSATTDISGDYYVGWTGEGEWLKYTVDVQNAGYYSFAVRYASAIDGTIAISFVSGEETVIVTADVPSTGAWSNWDWVNINVAGLKAGTQALIVKPTVNINYFEISQNPVTGITVQKKASVAIGSSVQLTTVILPDNASNPSVIWKSLNEAVATVSNAGLVTAVALGDVYIKVTTIDGSLSDSCLVNVGATGINNLNYNLVNVFPNPVTAHLKLSIVADIVVVTNIEGKIIATKLNSNDVDLTNLSAGMYFVRIGLNGQFITEKIIKK